MPVEILLLRSYRLACTVGNRSLPLPDLENKREIMPTKSAAKKCVMAILRNPAWVCLIWFGMTAGVSLLATPVRFTATTLTRPVALDVGRVVFAALNKAEFVALIILLVVVRLTGKAKELWAFCGILTLILMAQSIWLLPELAARTDLIIAGIEPAPSIVHAAYSTLELSKLLLLLYMGFRSLQLLMLDQGARSRTLANS